MEMCISGHPSVVPMGWLQAQASSDPLQVHVMCSAGAEMWQPRERVAEAEYV